MSKTYLLGMRSKPWLVMAFLETMMQVGRDTSFIQVFDLIGDHSYSMHSYHDALMQPSTTSHWLGHVNASLWQSSDNAVESVDCSAKLPYI